MKPFLNPYHFIPLSKKKIVGEPLDEKANLTGRIEVEIRTKTPLFIPNTSNEHALKVPGSPEGHKSYDFFSYNQLTEPVDDRDETREPVIPGSEIRGMIRSVYEALTASCLSAVDDSKTILKRTEQTFDAGLIYKEKGQYFLAGGKREKIKEDNPFYNQAKTLPEGTTLYYSSETNKRISTSPQDRMKAGYLLKGEPGPEMEEKSKAGFAIITLKNDGETIAHLTDSDLARFNTVLDSYDKNKEKVQRDDGKVYTGYKEYRKQWNDFQKNGTEYFPVYYCRIKDSTGSADQLYLSPACITKKAYKNTIGDILKAHGQFEPCEDESQLCQACRLFGMVSDTAKVASRVRFTDARLEKASWKGYYQKPVTLPTIDTPKISTTEFYLKRPENASYWTFDYWRDQRGNPTLYVPEIAGRKFYWHSSDVLRQSAVPGENNRTIRPIKIKDDNAFKTWVYFERLTEKELKQLVYLLNISGKGTRGYKMGGAKPFGYGSITMKTNRVLIRRLSVNENNDIVIEEEDEIEKYCNTPYEDLFEPETKESFELLSDFDSTKSYSVSYPITDGQRAEQQGGEIVEEGFAWFSENKQPPMANDEHIQLEKYMAPLDGKHMALAKTK